MRNIRQVRKIGGKSVYITLPKEWANVDDCISFEIINENELKLKKVDVFPKVNPDYIEKLEKIREQNGIKFKNAEEFNEYFSD